MKYDELMLTLDKTDRQQRAMFCASFATPGRAGVVGQKLFSIWVPTTAAKAAAVSKVSIDRIGSAALVAGTISPLLRLYRVSSAPTNGSTLTPISANNLLAADVNIVVRGDASADGTLSGTALAHALGGGFLSQIRASRLITAAGEDSVSADVFDFSNRPIMLRNQSNAGQGLVLNAEYTDANANPATELWTVSVEWEEV